MAKKDLTPKVPQMSEDTIRALEEARIKRLASLEEQTNDEPINIKSKTDYIMDQLAAKLLKKEGDK